MYKQICQNVLFIVPARICGKICVTLKSRNFLLHVSSLHIKYSSYTSADNTCTSVSLFCQFYTHSQAATRHGRYCVEQWENIDNEAKLFMWEEGIEGKEANGWP